MLTNLESKRILAKTARMDHPNKIPTQALEAEWLEVQAAQKNTAAFRPLYDRYFDPIFRFIFKRVANESTTNDICSKVFLKALQNLSSYKFQGVPFSAWLYRLALNEVAQHFRQQKKNRVISIYDTELDQIIDEKAPHEREKQLAQLIKALDKLKEKDLTLVELRFFEGRPFKEIADILGITESNAKMRTYRALDKLKKFMTD